MPSTQSVLTVTLDSSKIVLDSADELVVPCTITREGVIPYPHGQALRPREELIRSAFTFDGAWITEGKHPTGGLIRNVDDVKGRITDVKIDLDATDPEGNKSATVTGNVHIWKERASPVFVTDVKEGKTKEISVGIINEEQFEKGSWNGKPYDFIQRNIFANHLAVGVKGARVKPPFIGLSLDAMTPKDIDSKISSLYEQRSKVQEQLDELWAKKRKENEAMQKEINAIYEKYNTAADKDDTSVSLFNQLQELGGEIDDYREAKVKLEVGANTNDSVDVATLSTDVWEENETTIRSGHGNASDAATCRTTDFDGKLPKGMKAIYCESKAKPGTWYVQSFLFSIKDGWDMAKAKAWFKEHSSSVDTTTADSATPPGAASGTPPAAGAKPKEEKPPAGNTPPPVDPPAPPKKTVYDFIDENKKALQEAAKPTKFKP